MNRPERLTRIDAATDRDNSVSNRSAVDAAIIAPGQPAAQALVMSQVPGGNQNLGTAGETAPTYRYRTVDCETCGGHKFVTYLDDDGFTGKRCDECLGGQVDAACADCLVVRPLGDEGFCQPCAEASILSVDEWNLKHAPHRLSGTLHEMAMKARVRL